MSNPREAAEESLMRLIAFALDAAIEQGVPMTPDQYREALLQAMEWANSSGHKPRPEYAEELETAVVVWLVKWRARQTCPAEEQ